MRFPLQLHWYVPVFFLKWQQRVVCASFFFKMAAAIRCCPIPKLNNCYTTKIQLLLPKPKFKIQYLQFNTYSIQNSIFYKYNNSKYLHNHYTSLYMHTLESCYNILQLRQILLYIILYLLQVYYKISFLFSMK